MALLLAASFSSLLFSRYEINNLNQIKSLAFIFGVTVDEVQSKLGLCTMNRVYTIYVHCTCKVQTLNMYHTYIVYTLYIVQCVYDVCMIHV